MFFNMETTEISEVSDCLKAFDIAMIKILHVSENYYVGFHLSRAKQNLYDVMNMVGNSIISIPIASLKYRIDYLKNQCDSIIDEPQRKILKSLRKVS
jgi:hypothetical protein